MPAIYAHYRLGQDCFKKFNEKQQNIIRRHREVFDMGLQGADFLFYNLKDPTVKSEMLATKIHYEPCINALRRFLKKGKLTESEVAYIYGFIGHFALDSKCHPLINALSKIKVDHHRLEMEFDRFLLKKDGYTIGKINLKDFSPVSLEVKETLVSLYSNYPISKRKIIKSIEAMHHVKNFLFIDSEKKYQRIKKFMNILKLFDKFSGHIMYEDDNLYEKYYDELYYLYNRAYDIYPILLYDFDKHQEDLNFSAYFNINFE